MTGPVSSWLDDGYGLLCRRPQALGRGVPSTVIYTRITQDFRSRGRHLLWVFGEGDSKCIETRGYVLKRAWASGSGPDSYVRNPPTISLAAGSR